MARLGKSSPLNQLSGAVGKQLIFKQYKYGTVVSAYPDMTRVKRSGMQKMKQSIFADAVAYAQSIIHDRVKKKAWEKKLKKGESVYHAAIKYYMKRNKFKDPGKFLG